MDDQELVAVNTSTNTASVSEVENLDRADVMHGFSTLHAQATNDVVVIKSANGLEVIDNRGRQFLDAGGGLWCMNVGYGRQAIADVAAMQMAKLPYFHSFGFFSNEPLIRLAERILKLAPGGMVRAMFCSSGSEANDTQIKVVRRYNNLLGRPQKKKIIARLGSYHGSTVAAGSLSGLPMMHETFDLPIPGILHTLSTDYHRRPKNIATPEEFTQYLLDNLTRLIETEGPHTIAAFIAEPITGTGGVLVPPPGYFREVKRVLDRYDILMIADEVITGFGRTGAWFASQSLDLKPDLVSIAKGLTSGYFPMSACLLSARVADVLYADKSRTQCSRTALPGPVIRSVPQLRTPISTSWSVRICPVTRRESERTSWNGCGSGFRATRSSAKSAARDYSSASSSTPIGRYASLSRNTGRLVASSVKPASRSVSSCAAAMTARSQPSPPRSSRQRRTQTRSSSASVVP